VAVKWRTKNDITIDLASVLPKHGVAFSAAGAARVHADSNRVELGDGTFLDYDYLVIATGPELAFDEIEGLARKRTVTPSAMWTTPRAPTHDGKSFAKIPVQSWSAPCKEPRVTAQLTNSR
jgi:NADPH-dependent 2,4-dienoyl-CoA reductase/sulfur reductase-like enzyme